MEQNHRPSASKRERIASLHKWFALQLTPELAQAETARVFEKMFWDTLTGPDGRVRVERMPNAIDRLKVMHDEANRYVISASPESAIDSQRITEFVRPRIEQLRMEVFGSPGPPFRSVEATRRWISGQSSSRTPPTEKASKQAQALIQEAARLTDKAAKLIKSHWSGPRFSYYRLPYFARRKATGPNVIADSDQTFPCDMASPLGRIAVLTEELSEHCSVSQLMMVDHFFRGEPLTVPYAVITTNRKLAPLVHHLITVTYTRPLTIKELRAVDKDLHVEWEIKRRKRPLADDAPEFLRLVKACGNPNDLPHGGGIRYWTGVLRKWEKTHPGQLKAWDSCLKKYLRLQGRMNQKLLQ